MAGSTSQEAYAGEIAADLARAGWTVVMCTDGKRDGARPAAPVPEGCSSVTLPRPKRDRLWAARERLIAAAELARLHASGSTDKARISSIAEKAPRRLRPGGGRGWLLATALAGLPPTPQIASVLAATGGTTVILVAGQDASVARLAFASAAQRSGARVISIGGAPFAETLPATASVQELAAILDRSPARRPGGPGPLALAIGLLVTLRLGRRGGAAGKIGRDQPAELQPAAASADPGRPASLAPGSPDPAPALAAPPDENGLRILFFMHAANFDRLFEASIRQILAAGHSLHIAADGAKGDTQIFERIAAVYPNLTFGRAPAAVESSWTPLAQGVRAAINFLRYLDRRYDDAVALRERAAQRAPASVVKLARSRIGRRILAAKATFSLLRLVEASAPVDAGRAAFIEQHAPDIVLVTPLVGLGTTQGDYIRSARRLGIPSALLVASWDNLTNKGRILTAPDRVIVWNPAQVEEAVELHDIPRAAVVATGAHPYDQWFDWRPSTTREEFCERVGLDPARPIILYVGSSAFIAPDESRWVTGWLDALRGSLAPGLSDAAVLIRPHPQNAATWETADIVRPGLTTIWPRGGATPTSAESKAEYFDSIYHCSAVVGINTSALIESAIIERPVLTLLSDEFRSTQDGTLHFAHLSDPESGVLTVARTLEEHHAQLASALGGDASTERLRRFVGSFVRPHGLDTRAAPLVIEAIERTAALPIAATGSPLHQLATRAALQPAVAAAAVTRRTATALSIRRRPSVRAARPAPGKHLKVAFVLDESMAGNVWLRSLVLRLTTEGHRVVLAFESLTVGGRKSLVQDHVSVAVGLRSRDDSYRRAARLARSRSGTLLGTLLERAIPSMEAADRLIEKASPDVCVMLQPNSTAYTVELLKSAQALGVPTIALGLDGDRIAAAGRHTVDVRVHPGSAGAAGRRHVAAATTGDDIARLIAATALRRTGRAHAARVWNLPARVALGLLGAFSPARPSIRPVVRQITLARTGARRPAAAGRPQGKTTAAERKAAKPPKPTPKQRTATPQPAPRISRQGRMPSYLAHTPEDKANRPPRPPAA